VSSHHSAVTVNDRADRIDHGKNGHLRRTEVAERAALAARLGPIRPERLSKRGGAPGATPSKQEHAASSSRERGAAELLVGIDGIAARAEVEDDRADDSGRLRVDAIVAAFENLRGDPGRRLEPVQRPAGKTDRAHALVVAERAGMATADVDRDGRRPRKMEDGAARRTLLVLSRTDLDSREVEDELRATTGNPRLEGQQVIGDHVAKDGSNLTTHATAPDRGSPSNPDLPCLTTTTSFSRCLGCIVILCRPLCLLGGIALWTWLDKRLRR
jgi:hypothetical protein